MEKADPLGGTYSYHRALSGRYSALGVTLAGEGK
jgi:hypothetical protein